MTIKQYAQKMLYEDKNIPFAKFLLELSNSHRFFLRFKSISHFSELAFGHRDFISNMARFGGIIGLGRLLSHTSIVNQWKIDNLEDYMKTDTTEVEFSEAYNIFSEKINEFIKLNPYEGSGRLFFNTYVLNAFSHEDINIIDVGRAYVVAKLIGSGSDYKTTNSLRLDIRNKILEDLIKQYFNFQEEDIKEVFIDRLFALYYEMCLEMEKVPDSDISGQYICETCLSTIEVFIDKYFPETELLYPKARNIYENYHIYQEVRFVADWPFKVAGLPEVEKFVRNRGKKNSIMRNIKDYYFENENNPHRKIFEILAPSYISSSAKDFNFQGNALKFFKTEFIEEYLKVNKKGKYNEYVSGKTSGADLEGLSGAAMWMVEYCKRNDIGIDDHGKLIKMVKKMPGGLGAEIPMFYHTQLSDVSGDPNYSFEDKIRVWNAKADIFTLRYDKTTNTLEIGDFKPDLNFDTQNPGDHFANAIMQVLVYALTVQKETGGEVNIRCLVFNQNGFIQFEPNSMCFELLNLMTNLKVSEWHYHIQAEMNRAGQDPDIISAYQDNYIDIMPSLDAMKFFIDFYGTADTSVLYSDVSDQSYYTYLKHSYLRAVESKIGEMQRLVQNEYLDTLEENHPDIFGGN